MTNNDRLLTMNTHAQCLQSYEFHFRDVDTHVLVENLEDGVVIHASHNTFSEGRKLSFIRELAAEGFIADCFQWSCRDVRWLVDASIARTGRDGSTRTNRFMIQLLIGSALLWLALMADAILHGAS
ncbi:MAG TPA: hypothetical protein VL171_07255 [Verrucomicrobiae bacterium]|nr:hypothetical protein [Verrucomicrobiae bacterium]